MFSTLSKTQPPELATRFARDEKGATAIEYALIAAGIAVAVAATVYNLGSATKGMFDSVANKL